MFTNRSYNCRAYHPVPLDSEFLVLASKYREVGESDTELRIDQEDDDSRVYVLDKEHLKHSGEGLRGLGVCGLPMRNV